MKVQKRYIFILIIVALLSLIGLQMLWLAFVYQYKAQELKDKTREAALETTYRLQKEEDAELILNNMDSLLVTDNIIGSDSKDNIRVIVSNIKHKLKIDTLKGETRIERKINLINDSSVSTTVVKIGNGKNHQVIVHSESHDLGNVKKKAGDLKELFLKMATEANFKSGNVLGRLDFDHLKTILKEELTKRGIDLSPEVIISSKLKEFNNIKTLFKGLQTPNSNPQNKSFVSLPLFPNDILSKDFTLEVGFKSSINYLVKQMVSLLALSLLLSLLIAFVIIYIFRRMLSQDKLHQLKNDFINNMTHELKTPIATISLALDGITNPQIKNDNEKFTNYCNILKEENKKLNNHVEHVLQMSLLEQGLIPLNKKSTNIVSLIKDSINTYQLQIQNKKAIVNFNCNLEEVILNADEFYLGNVFNNLLDNALKYSADFCKIDISLTKNANVILISFKDDGIGIEKNQQAKVFEKFYRVQSGNIHDTKGFGLGLSYVKSIVEAHGGIIELKSEKDKGSEFILTLK